MLECKVSPSVSEPLKIVLRLFILPAKANARVLGFLATGVSVLVILNSLASTLFDLVVATKLLPFALLVGVGVSVAVLWPIWLTRVWLAAKRSKQLQRGAQPRIEIDPQKHKPTRIALEEVIRGRVHFDIKPEES